MRVVAAQLEQLALHSKVPDEAVLAWPQDDSLYQVSHLCGMVAFISYTYDTYACA